jgi:hypothetical protein
MADQKVTALTELTTFSGDETLYVVEDDDGTPVSRRVTIENLAVGLALQMTNRRVKKARRTAGDVTLNSTNWANVDTGIDITLSGVVAGDQILYGINARVDTQTVVGFFDVVTVVGGSPVNSFAVQGAVETAPGTIISGWRTDGTGERVGITGDAPPYTLVSGDISSGSVTLRLRYATGTAANLTLKAGGTTPLDVWARNIGPLQT